MRYEPGDKKNHVDRVVWTVHGEDVSEKKLRVTLRGSAWNERFHHGRGLNLWLKASPPVADFPFGQGESWELRETGKKVRGEKNCHRRNSGGHRDPTEGGKGKGKGGLPWGFLEPWTEDRFGNELLRGRNRSSALKQDREEAP